MEFTLNFNTFLSVGAMLGVAVVGWVQSDKTKTVNDIKERIKDVREEQTRQAERIDRIYDILVNGKKES